MADAGEGSAPDARSRTKAARNERRKLLASLFNNLGAALALAAFVQPVLAFVQGLRAVRLVEIVASLMFFALASALVVAAQYVAERLED